MNSTCETPPHQPLLSAELRTIINERNILTTQTRMKVLSALDKVARDSHRLQQMEHEKHLRCQAIKEILTSEASYLHQIEVIKKFYMDPLKSKDFVSESEWNILFGNIETLYTVNGALLQELKVNSENVASAFLKLAPYFKIYSVYAYDYKKIVHFIQEVQHTNPRLASFIADQETRPEVGCKLSALLIVPIQRIPRYRLLLQEVLNHTTPFQQDYYVLKNAVREVEQTAEHINGLMLEQENMEKMVQLQNSLYRGRPGIITPGRKFLKEGILIKVTANGRRPLPRYFILFSDMLIYCKVRAGKRPSQTDALSCCCILPLKHCLVESVLSQGVFRLSCRGESFILYSSCVDDTRKWIQALEGALKQYRVSYQTLRKDSSSRRPIRRKNLSKMPSNVWTQNIRPFPHNPNKRKRDVHETDSSELSGQKLPELRCLPDTPDQKSASGLICLPECPPRKIRRSCPQSSERSRKYAAEELESQKGTESQKLFTNNKCATNGECNVEIGNKQSVQSADVIPWSPFNSFKFLGNFFSEVHKSLRRSLRRSLYRFTPEIRLQ